MKTVKISDLKLPLDTDFNNLKPIAAKSIGCDLKDIKDVKLYRKSVDARRKSDVHFCVSLVAKIGDNIKRFKSKSCAEFTEKEYEWKTSAEPHKKTIVAGFGPCGIFAALTLARAGLKPVVLERGCDVDTRTCDVAAFFAGGKLKENSNVQFGEGGAGTFSDGKLTTGIKDIRLRAVLKEFYNHGADEAVLYDAKPHIGTDVLKKVVKNIREEIITLGGEVRFNSLLEDLVIKNGKICGAVVNSETIECDNIILCCGHSARDTFKMLKKNNAEMIRKPFAVGVRIEHLQEDINKALYGDFYKHKALPPANYKMAVHLESGRGVYTFCMCPGGSVINASSSEQGIAVNGMSESKRDGKNANSALLVNVEPADFPGDDVLSGCAFQEKIEKAAYLSAGGSVPVDTVGHFLYDKTARIGKVTPTVLPRYAFCDFEKIFPPFVTESLKEGIKLFDRKINGFADCDAVLTAPETRSSSPVRVLRDENGLSNIKGLYPAGEGAGYAGGIMSAAVDGIRVAEHIIGQIE